MCCVLLFIGGGKHRYHFGDTLRLYVFRLPQGLLLKDHDSVNKIYSEFAKRKENIRWSLYRLKRKTLCYA